MLMELNEEEFQNNFKKMLRSISLHRNPVVKWSIL